VRSADECDDGIVDSIPNEPPQISTTTVCLLRFIRINSGGEKLAARTLPFVHVPGAINPADMLSKHWGTSRLGHNCRLCYFDRATLRIY
jgi:hypothetical protein